MERRLRLKRSQPQAGLEPRTARSIGQRVTYCAIGAPRAPVAQSVKRWPTDLAYRVRSPFEVNFLNRKRSSIAQSLLLSTSHRPDMT